jgi:hypothetical protein
MVGAAGTGLAAFLITQRRGIARRLQAVTRNSSPATRYPQKPKPKPLPGLAPGKVAGQKAKPIPGLAGQPPPKTARPIPGLRRTPQSKPPETKLQAAPVQIRDSAGRQTTLDNSFRVVRADGSDTGLAITPCQAGANGSEQPRWGVTHAAGGALIDGPFNSPQAAQQLAAKLTPLRWTERQVPAADVSRARAIVKAHHTGGSD